MNESWTETPASAVSSVDKTGQDDAQVAMVSKVLRERQELIWLLLRLMVPDRPEGALHWVPADASSAVVQKGISRHAANITLEESRDEVGSPLDHQEQEELTRAVEIHQAHLSHTTMPRNVHAKQVRALKPVSK